MDTLDVVLTVLLAFALWGLFFKADWYPGDRQAEAERDRMLDEYEARMKAYKNKPSEPNEQEQS